MRSGNAALVKLDRDGIGRVIAAFDLGGQPVAAALKPGNGPAANIVLAAREGLDGRQRTHGIFVEAENPS